MTHSWSNGCIYHRDEDAESFVDEYFKRKACRVLWIGGAGYDPRSTYIPKLLNAASAIVRCLLVREHRPRPHAQLLSQADTHQAMLQALFPQSKRMDVQVFSQDEATVTGGRDAVRQLHQEDLTDVTDIVLDMSTLSVGISFPLARWLYQTALAAENDAAGATSKGTVKKKRFPNVHVMAVSTPVSGEASTSELLDRHQMIHGFDGGLDIQANVKRARLWLPLLAEDKREAMRIIHSGIQPDETCPILPFPAASPRMVESLIEAYSDELRQSWNVDRRDFLYAAENDPLDLYQTILRLDTSRGLTYQVAGGAVTLLSPLGSKVMAVGALMAALERDLPVVYVETQRYAVPMTPPPPPSGIVHVWLTGSAYN
jgi:hypothetical protein